MDNQNLPNAQSLSNKRTMADFVHDVADMEVRVFSMREAAKKVREDEKQKKGRLEWEVSHCQKQTEAKQTEYDQAIEEKEKIQTFGKFRKRNFKGYLVPVNVILAFLLLGVLERILFELFPDVSSSAGLTIWYIVFFTACCFVEFFHYIYLKRNYCKELDKRKRVFAEKASELATAQNTLEAAKEALRAYMENLPKILSRADRLEADAALVEKKLRECYALKIIQPAYQKLVCAVILDEIFSNDKADTMREAMLLCDAEIRHADIMGKMDEVIDALHMLSYQLQSMSSVLDSINTNVGLISQDVYAMRGSQAQVAYSVEAIRQSTQNVDSYIAQRRAGVL